MKTFLKNAYVITMNPKREVYENGSVLIDGDRIVDAGFVKQPDDCREVVDCKGKIVMPSFVNTHTHTSQQLARGLADDVDLLTWLRERIWPYETNMSEADSPISTLLFCAEQIKAGCTSIAEPGGQHVAGMVRAVEKAGIRAKLAKSVMDCGEGLPAVWQKSTQEELDIQEELIKKFNHTAEDRIQVWFGIRTIFNATDELILRSKELADKYGVGVHMHIAEAKAEVEYARETRGVTTVTHLNNLGFLDKNVIAAHAVWLTNEEVEMFRKHQVKVSHNPASAMRVLGFAKIPRMLREGVCVALGTDGAPTNNRMNMVDEMWVTSLIHKGWRLEPDAVKEEEILAMATINGARAVGDEGICGSLEAGKKADLIIIDPDCSVDMLPIHDPIANLVTSMHSTNIESTMCDGKWLMKDRKLLTIDEEEIIREGKEHAREICRRGGIKLPERFPVKRR